MKIYVDKMPESCYDCKFAVDLHKNYDHCGINRLLNSDGCPLSSLADHDAEKDREIARLKEELAKTEEYFEIANADAIAAMSDAVTLIDENKRLNEIIVKDNRHINNLDKRAEAAEKALAEEQRARKIAERAGQNIVEYAYEKNGHLWNWHAFHNKAAAELEKENDNA